jgi:hypothetical protein
MFITDNKGQLILNEVAISELSSLWNTYKKNYSDYSGPVKTEI